VRPPHVQTPTPRVAHPLPATRESRACAHGFFRALTLTRAHLPSTRYTHAAPAHADRSHAQRQDSVGPAARGAGRSHNPYFHPPASAAAALASTFPTPASSLASPTPKGKKRKGLGSTRRRSAKTLLANRTLGVCEWGERLHVPYSVLILRTHAHTPLHTYTHAHTHTHDHTHSHNHTHNHPPIITQSVSKDSRHTLT
jgi:hypothetical protein